MDKIDHYINLKSNWKSELQILRSILQETNLEETLKWGIPVYALKGKNVVGIAAFKNYVGLWFYQGVFLKDRQKLLINAQEGKTKALRQLRFKTIDDIDVNILKNYVQEAIENQHAGKELKPQKTTSISIPEELKTAFNQNQSLLAHFEKLSLSKQKEYAEYIQQAKQESTKTRRIEKIIPLILGGVGLYDKYK